MRIGIGIDTGGTYTDAVAYDFDTKQIMGSAKALTTKQDLSVGIVRALDGLPAHLLPQAQMLSLSTTLATNACVEDHGGPARLVFLGVEPKTLKENGPAYGLPDAQEIYLPRCEKDGLSILPDWALFRREIADQLRGMDGAGVVEVFAKWDNAQHERQAKKIIEEETGLPVVCGHELSHEINSLKRGAGTLLNARLFSVIHRFLLAIRQAMELRGLTIPIVIVRSDSSLMGEEFARLRPVETLLCGPAASVMGAVGLTGEQNLIVVDMGGTTTDIALVRSGVPVRASQGVSIGRWRTYVKGLYIRTVGLGGDSAIHHRDGALVLEAYRVVPLCVACAEHPQMLAKLRDLAEKGRPHTRPLHEFFLLVCPIQDHPRYTAFEKEFCHALMDGPLPLREAAQAVGKDIYELNVERLVSEGIVARCGLTPTDIMHITGDFSQYQSEASGYGARCVARNLGITVEELCVRIYDEVKRRIYRNVVHALLENTPGHDGRHGVGPEVERLIDESYDMAGQPGGFGVRFHTQDALVGIGAPIGIFLQDVARMLGTRAVVPEHAGVANALGAVMQNVYVTKSVEVKPLYEASGITGYTVLADEGYETYATQEEAEQAAKSAAERTVRQEALERGAVGEIAIACEITRSQSTAWGSPLYLGSTATAQAVGGIGI